MELDKVVIIIPSLNPDEKLGRVLGSMREAGFCRFVVVDDGSDGDHKAPFEEAKKAGCTVLVHDVNYGKGRALRTAFSYVLKNMKDAEFVITADGDGQHKASDALKLAERLFEQPEEVAMGCRCFTLPGVPRRNSFGNRMTSRILKLFSGIELSDTQTGFRGIPVKYLKEFCTKVTGDRFEYETNMLLYMHDADIEFTEVGIETVYIDGNKTSHYRVFADSFKIGKQIAKHSPIWRQLVSSLVCALLDIGLFTMLSSLFSESKVMWLRIFLATAIARVVSAFVNFLMNKFWVFKSRARFGRSMGRYGVLAAVQMLLSWLLVTLLTAALSPEGMKLTLLKFCVDTLLFIISYFVQKNWVFKK